VNESTIRIPIWLPKHSAEQRQLLLPHTAAYLGPRNLDVGCGSAVASVIHAAQLGLSPTLSDVIDIRHAQARALPFRLINAGALSFPGQALRLELPAICAAPSARRGRDRCPAQRMRAGIGDGGHRRGGEGAQDRHRARTRLRSGHERPPASGRPMPVFGYLSADSVKAQLSAAGALPVAHSVVR